MNKPKVSTQDKQGRKLEHGNKNDNDSDNDSPVGDPVPA